MDLRTERSLFEACVELSPDEREAWLAAHCPEAAARERIRKLLLAHDQAEAEDALQSPVPPQRHMGPYRLIERIGEGAMGEVYLAEQLKPVARRVALKVIKPGMDSREVIARFEQERQTLALMSHPSIAHIIDAGTTENGRLYFAMEYVPGIPLTMYCDRHRLNVDARLALFLRICDAVQHAHQKGVIHRDLKPGNLLVTDLDGQPTPKVIDFGIAKAVTPGQQASNAHTRIGHLIGTPEYMSPEQAQLSPLDVDTRADVYSLGVVLHELLAGTLPFRTTNPDATPAMLVQELLTHNPAAPSARVLEATDAKPDCATHRSTTPRQLAARLKGDLDWIVLKALEKDRNRRYGSPSELAADIRRHLANEPVSAGPPSVIYRLGKFASRHRLAMSVAGGLFAATLLFGVLMARQASELKIQRDEALFQAQRAEASSEFMSLMLEEVGPGGRALSPIELVDRGVELLSRQYGSDPKFAVRMFLQMSRRYADLGSIDKQEDLLTRAETLARELKDDDLFAAVTCTIASSGFENRVEEAKQRVEMARAALARLKDPPVRTRVDCLRGEADVADLAHDSATALARLQEARALLEQSGDTKGLRYNAVLTDIGGVYFRSNRFREALELNEGSAAALDRNGRGGTLAKATVMVNRATLLFRLGEVRQARSAYQDAMRRLEALRPGQPPTPAIAVNYSVALIRLGMTGEARDLLAAAREQSRTLGNQHWQALAAFHLGRTMLLAGHPEPAQPRFDEAR
jgi:eukaryotic-like serine/threonine-protein kinase